MRTKIKEIEKNALVDSMSDMGNSSTYPEVKKKNSLGDISNISFSGTEKTLNRIGNGMLDSRGENELHTTPSKRQRWFIFLTMFIYSAIVGCHFFNWVPWEDIFLANFLPQEGCVFLEGEEKSNNTSCENLTHITNRMFLIFQASMYSFSFVSGLVFDLVGPKLCSVLGNLLLILGWLIFFNSSSFQMYEFALALIGAGTDAAFFGTMATAKLFINHTPIVIAVLRAARSLSNIFPVILKNLGQRWPKVFNLSGISLCFIILHVFCLVVAYIFIPAKNQSVPESNSPEKTLRTSDKEIHEKESFLSLCDEESTHIANGLSYLSNGKMSGEGKYAFGVSCPTPMLGSKKEGLKHKIHDSTMKKAIHTLSLKKKKFIGSFRGVILWVKEKLFILCQELNILKRHLYSMLYLPVVLIAVINLLRNDYYILSAKRRLGSGQSTLTILNIFLFVPGPICGYLVNRFGPFHVMNGINVLIGLSFFCTILVNFVVNDVVKHILLHTSVLLMFPSLGFSMSQIYCYIHLVFDSSDIGKLSGFASFVAGIFSLLTEFMTKVAIGKVGFVKMDLIVIGMTFITLSLIFLIMYKASFIYKGDTTMLNRGHTASD